LYQLCVGLTAADKRDKLNLRRKSRHAQDQKRERWPEIRRLRDGARVGDERKSRPGLVAKPTPFGI